jgi:hypothetical protein
MRASDDIVLGDRDGGNVLSGATVTVMRWLESRAGWVLVVRANAAIARAKAPARSTGPAVLEF